MLCDSNDKKSTMEYKEEKEDDDVSLALSDDEYVFVNAINHNEDTQAMDMMHTYGDTAITKILNETQHKCKDTPMARANQLIRYLQNKEANKNRRNSSSYEDLQKGMMHLSAVLEHITAIILDSAGFIARSKHSITHERDDHHADIVRETMDKNRMLLSQFDEDMYSRDVEDDRVMIRPSHIRQAIADDDGLFWLQQAIQLKGEAAYIGNNSENDIEEELNKDCVYHICSFFCGDVPMLSSLARVNSTFYVMTSRNNLWKPIAQ
eukprot:258250_1